jgi:hypothetical protein
MRHEMMSPLAATAVSTHEHPRSTHEHQHHGGHRFLLLLLACQLSLVTARTGLLHPQSSETRELLDLGGIYRFRVDQHGEGFRKHWEAGVPDTVPMAVPSSYNDLTQDPLLREHVGLVWYEREAFVPAAWASKRVVLFVGSANHHAIAFLNGQNIGEHVGGHLPFHLPLDPQHVQYGRSNRLTIALNNTLSTTTIPSGHVQVNAAGRRIQRLQMDFFNYARLPASNYQDALASTLPSSASGACRPLSPSSDLPSTL